MSMTNLASVRTRVGTRPARTLAALVAFATVALGLVLVAAPVRAAPPAHAAAAQATTACRLVAEPPYKHIRSTGQKQVYGNGYFSCTGGRTSLRIEVRLNVYTTAGWYVYGRTAVGTNSGVTTAKAYEFLCNNYGWGDAVGWFQTGRGYFRTEARGVYFDYATQRTWTTAWKASDWRTLYC